MSTTEISPELHPQNASAGVIAAESRPARPTASPVAARSLAVLRIATGFIFLWAFVDKLFGLGYSTQSTKSWLSGGSPTSGFLGHTDVGPLQSFFVGLSGSVVVDVLFMLGMGAIGVAVIAGVGLWASAIAGTILMLGMWAAEWPLARFNSAGEAAGSTNPLVDYHIIYALALIVVAATLAGNTWGLGKRWAELPFVRNHTWLR